MFPTMLKTREIQTFTQVKSMFHGVASTTSFIGKSEDEKKI